MRKVGIRRVLMSELYQLPAGWEWVEWDGIVDIKNGKHYKDVINPDGKYPIYGSGGVINFADEYLCNEDSVIIGRKGTINSPIFVKEKFWNIDTAFGLEANRNLLVPMFLYYFTQNFNFLDLNTATTMPSLTKSNLQKIKMPLPPLTEQERIVQKLDALFERIDKAIALLQKNIDAADNFMNSVLNDVFSELEQNYEKELWGNMLTIKNGKHYKDVVDDNGQYPIYGSGGVLKYANNYICNENSVIIGRKGTINSPLFVREKFWNIDTAFGIESNTDKLVPVFLFYFTVKFNFLELNQSTTLPSLAKSHLLKIKMVLPPLEIQHKVVAYLDNLSVKVEQVKSAQQQKMQNLLDLKSSILDHAFHGKL